MLPIPPASLVQELRLGVFLRVFLTLAPRWRA